MLLKVAAVMNAIINVDGMHINCHRQNMKHLLNMDTVMWGHQRVSQHVFSLILAELLRRRRQIDGRKMLIKVSRKI